MGWFARNPTMRGIKYRIKVGYQDFLVLERVNDIHIIVLKVYGGKLYLDHVYPLFGKDLLYAPSISKQALYSYSYSIEWISMDQVMWRLFVLACATPISRK